MSIHLSTRRADILASVAIHVAAKCGVTDKMVIAESWRQAGDESFRQLVDPGRHEAQPRAPRDFSWTSSSGGRRRGRERYP